MTAFPILLCTSRLSSPSLPPSFFCVFACLPSFHSASNDLCLPTQPQHQVDQPPSLLLRKSPQSLILHQPPHNIAPEINIETNPPGPPLILYLISSSFLCITPSNPTLANNHNPITRRQQWLRPPHLLPLLKHHLSDPDTNPARDYGMIIPQEAVPPPLLFAQCKSARPLQTNEQITFRTERREA